MGYLIIHTLPVKSKLPIFQSLNIFIYLINDKDQVITYTVYSFLSRQQHLK